MPEKYYYDDKKYDDNYFIFIPKNGNFSYTQVPRIKDNIVCCWDKLKAQSNAPSVYKNLQNNKDKNIENISNTFLEEEHFHLSKFKLGKMPDAIYDNICKFLTLPNKKEIL